MLPLAATGVLAVSGVVLALLTVGTLLLRLALCLACAGAVALAVLMWWRDRQHVRALAVEAAGRRRDQSLVQSQLDALHETLAALREQLEQMRVESGELRSELMSLRAGKVEAEEALRRLRAVPTQHSLRHPLTPDSFAAAAAVLEAFEVGGNADEEDWISSWVSGLFDDEGDLVIDLTVHDDTLPLELRVARGA
jgi:hypothetical protein